MNIKGQGHSLTLIQGHSDSAFSNFFFLETVKPIEAKLHGDPPCDGGTNVCPNALGHMSKLAPCPYMVKNIKKTILLWNQTADDLES